MKLSLVVATLRRTKEVELLFESLALQSFRNFEVILVDQNDDARLEGIVEAFAARFPIVHLRSSVRNCCHARNLGLAEATGDLVGFPDDDCRYKHDTALRVVQRFEKNPALTLLTGNCVSPDGRLINGRWALASGEITPANVWTTMQGFTMWARAAALRKAHGFDASIGPGTQWGSSEEPDLALRMLRQGAQGFYDVEIGILHPDNASTSLAADRAFLYGAGMGRVFRRNRVPLSISYPFFVRPVGGLLLSLFRGRSTATRYYWATLRGRMHGMLAPLERS